MAGIYGHKLCTKAHSSVLRCKRVYEHNFIQKGLDHQVSLKFLSKIPKTRVDWIEQSAKIIDGR